MVGAAETPYDLRFRLLGIPVRVHPLFWMVIGRPGLAGSRNLPLVAVWVACGFVSILVHEFGHGLMSRCLAARRRSSSGAWVGLCYSQGERQTPGNGWPSSSAGPAPGFVFMSW